MKSDVAKREEETLRYWQKHNIFEATLSSRLGKPEFVFYDGPPFATGLPHTGSLLSSVIKDVIPRYKTMRGFYVRRRWGWDTHGLPIENMVEKDLGLKSKKDIEAMGIEKFNEACRAKVLMYVRDWKLYIDRVGRWVDFENSYKTMDATYTESVWWALKELHKKDLLYEGRKVLMYCPHCETPLAKAEIAMDNSYKDITEEAVTVKFKLQIANSKNFNIADTLTYLLAWTTTPWTLPANVALAVGSEIEYALVSRPALPYNKGGEGERYVVASALVEKYFGPDAKVEKTFFGKELEGLEYEPFYELDAVKETGKRSHYVALADFVNTNEGTGIVHTAVIYGEDDYQLGLKNDLPMVPLLNPNGTYNNDAPEFLRGQYIKKADKMVIEDLEERGLLFAKAPNTHSYPHCHRCNTPLIYNALSSWFIDVQKNKKDSNKQNEKINWVPGHLKHGRFGNILEGAPDWTISRNRYWASPLPIWKCGECKKVEVIGSLSELGDRVTKSGNTYILMRHGEARGNVENFIESGSVANNHLTDKGIHDVEKSASEIKSVGVDIIFVSPVARAQETAILVKKVLNLSDPALITDERLGERSFGLHEGKPISEWHPHFASLRDNFTESPGGAETLLQLRNRIGDFLFDMEKRYADKKVLIITHGDPAWIMEQVTEHSTKRQLLEMQSQAGYLGVAQWKEVEFVPFPHDRNFELDFHRPYIDEIKLRCECGGEMKRIPEVVDCWVESGSMPFAEYHYPFENKSEFEKRSPGDFIAEYLGQTRTWFYYLHTVSTLLFGHEAFKNVVVTGNILAADGSKMSKSKGNYTDPLELIARYGADAYRYHLMTSVVMQAEDFNFSDDGVKEIYQRLVNILWNVVEFYKLYVPSGSTAVPDPKASPLGSLKARPSSPNVLDRWILARLAQLHKEVTENLDK